MCTYSGHTVELSRIDWKWKWENWKVKEWFAYVGNGNGFAFDRLIVKSWQCIEAPTIILAHNPHDGWRNCQTHTSMNFDDRSTACLLVTVIARLNMRILRTIFPFFFNAFLCGKTHEHSTTHVFDMFISCQSDSNCFRYAFALLFTQRYLPAFLWMYVYFMLCVCLWKWEKQIYG